MRKVVLFWGVVFSLLFAVAVRADEPPMPVPPAHPVETWTGVTSQGLPMSFYLVYTESGPMVQDWSFSFSDTCGKTNSMLSTGFGFFGFSLPAGQFDFSQRSLQFVFSWSGSVYNSGTSASGAASNILATVILVELDVDPGSTFDQTRYGVEKCESGPVYWNAWPVSMPPKGKSQSATTTGFDHSVTVYKDGLVIVE